MQVEYVLQRLGQDYAVEESGLDVVGRREIGDDRRARCSGPHMEHVAMRHTLAAKAKGIGVVAGFEHSPVYIGAVAIQEGFDVKPIDRLAAIEAPARTERL